MLKLQRRKTRAIFFNFSFLTKRTIEKDLLSDWMNIKLPGELKPFEYMLLNKTFPNYTWLNKQTNKQEGPKNVTWREPKRTQNLILRVQFNDTSLTGDPHYWGKKPPWNDQDKEERRSGWDTNFKCQMHLAISSLPEVGLLLKRIGVKMSRFNKSKTCPWN